ncbi:MAG: triose-phosphate isomerase [Calditrichaeota bacterium]|nr:triose-phosphate isomerase [Calditrichota bacterium]
MKRTILLAANWKMHKLSGEAGEFVQDYAAKLADSAVPTVLFPTNTALQAVASACKESGKSPKTLAFGAQNCYFQRSGAFTGEVSPEMLADLGCTYVVLGHSERRAIFGESDELIGKKVKAVLDEGLTPIFCIGETLDERNAGNLESVLTRQVEQGLADVKEDQLNKLVVAYEPVWAIGTGVVATPEQAQDAHRFVRTLLAKKNAQAAERMNILYGGSVKPDNCFELMSQPDIDGALVGGASLQVESLLALHKECVRASQ